MGDVMLQRECLIDPDMMVYSILSLDEAYERKIATDGLFGLFKGECELFVGCTGVDLRVESAGLLALYAHILC